MNIEITWLITGMLAHVTVTTLAETSRWNSVSWLMGPDGEQCVYNGLLGDSVTIGGCHSRNTPSYVAALAAARAQFAEQS